VKDQYVGDVNDYAKYAILRSVLKQGLPVALCWMLTRDDGTADGRKLRYLSRPTDYRSLDPSLFDHLAHVVGGDRRSISALEEDRLFPGTAFFGGVLEDERGPRRSYFRDLWATLRGERVVFFDPDNGLAVASRPKGRRWSSKYLYWDEVRECSSRGHSLMVFQHFPREERRTYLARLLDRLSVETDLEATFALQSPNVAFLVAAQPSHAEKLDQAAEAITRTWNDRIRIVLRMGPPGFEPGTNGL
jgi:hypothetical protein